MKPRRPIRRRGKRRFKHAHVDPEKLAWIRRCRCACAVTDGDFCEGRMEPHHEGEPGERDDRKVVPLCALGHHREGPHSRHKMGRERFEEFHGFKLDERAAELDRFYELREETPF